MDNSPLAPSISLTFRFATSEITRLHDAIEAFAEPFAPSAKGLFQFILAAEEIATNIINYSKNDAAAQQFDVILSFEDGCLKGEIIDSAPPFDPFHDAPEPDLTVSAAERRVGGLGIHLVKTVIDRYTYDRRDGRNHTTLVKNCAA